MSDTISERAKKILQVLSSSQALSRAAIAEATNETRMNTIRELNRLVGQHLVAVSGEARATVYAITEHGRTIVVWDAENYLAEEPDKRHARYTSLTPELFRTVENSIGYPLLLIESAAASRRQTEDSLSARKDLERFVIELSWKSSKIEGNTYTLLDTARLIKESEEAVGHTHDEAVMILNHKHAFEYAWQHQQDFRTLTRQAIEEVHTLLIKDLHVPNGLREHPVGITGTVYVPPASKIEISSYFGDIIDTINAIEQPVEKAMACLVLLPYLQPFADGNKRTSRLLGDATLLAYSYPPLSYRSIDEQAYKGALILFYEQGTLANFRDLFLEQLKESALNYYFPIES